MPEADVDSVPRWQMLAAFAAIYTIWGSTYLAIRFAIESLPAFLMAGARFTVAGTALYAWSRLRGVPRPTVRNWGAAAIVGGLLLLGGNGTVVWAEHRIPSGVTALLAGIVPLWIVLLDWLRPRGVRPRGLVFAGLGLGLAGIVILVGPGQLGGGHVDTAGALAMVLGTLLWAVGSLYSRRAPLPASPLLATSLEMLAGGVLLLLAAGFGGEWGQLNLAAVSARSALACGYLVIFGSLVAYSAYSWLLRVAPAARVATYAYVNPIVAVFLGWALAGEPLSARTLLAGTVIVTAVMLIVRGAGRAGPREAPAPAADSLDAATGGRPGPGGALRGSP